MVEDEPKVARALPDGLEAEGFGVTVARIGEEGFFQASISPFDLIVLDRMLPVRDGLEVLGALRPPSARIALARLFPFTHGSIRNRLWLTIRYSRCARTPSSAPSTPQGA